MLLLTPLWPLTPWLWSSWFHLLMVRAWAAAKQPEASQQTSCDVSRSEVRLMWHLTFHPAFRAEVQSSSRIHAKNQNISCSNRCLQEALQTTCPLTMLIIYCLLFYRCFDLDAAGVTLVNTHVCVCSRYVHADVFKANTTNHQVIWIFFCSQAEVS